MDPIPDITVSVDLGTTFTGVSWMKPSSGIRVINNWPGSGDRNEQKVPTALIYNLDGTLSSWGFLCDEEDEHGESDGKKRFQFFKIFMEPETLADGHEQGLANAPRTVAQARELVTEYLRQVYLHVKKTVEEETGRAHMGGWKNDTVEFLFSVPTTWTNFEIINSFKSVIHNAGFGVEGPRHSAKIDLTEAEAAAVSTLKSNAVQLRMGSVFLTVDAGGGTTDLALMHVTSADTAVPQTSSMNPVSGVGTGAALIDGMFVELASRRLAAYPEIMAQLSPNCIPNLAQHHQFRSFKHKMGQPAYIGRVLRVPLEGLPHRLHHPGAGIENGKLIFSLQEIQSLFDPNVNSIIQHIMEQFHWLQENGYPQQVEYIMLSGGLGSSAYVRQRLQQHFMNLGHPNARNVTVVPCVEPQLVVTKGLLHNQRQRQETGGTKSVLAKWTARASYGVIVQEAYMHTKHFDEEVVQDRFDPSKKWAVNQIQWLIKKGEQVDPNNPLVKSFEIRLAEGEVTRSWASKIVISHSDATFLPRSMKTTGATNLCEVKSNLTGVHQQQLVQRYKRGSCFSKGYKFYLCQFDIRVIVAPADLRFELWFGGEKFSGNHEPITIDWDKAGMTLKG